MKLIRKIIKKSLEEIFDSIETPKDTEFIVSSDCIIYKFKTNKKEYCVSFKKYNKFSPIGLTYDEKLNSIITNSNSIYYLSWGLFDSNDICYPIDDVTTDAKEAIYVFNSVFGIIKEFIIKYNPDSLFYDALGKRKIIYEKMFNKMNLNYLMYKGQKNIFLIRNDLL